MRAPKHIADNAKRLRGKLSKPEAMLWLRLRTREHGQPIFRRQHSMGPYVLDFYCAPAIAGEDEVSNRLIVFADFLMRAQHGVERLEHVAHARFRDRAFDDHHQFRLVG
jgi:very-short-patch-repair endonuclease